jgi:hypothetical protein
MMRSKEQIIEAAEDGAIIDGGEAGVGDTGEDSADDEEPVRLPNRGDLYDIPKDVPGAPE